MGTNYYFHEDGPCPTCGRGDEPRHIGKSSAGWCFSLHVYPEDGINTLDDWKAKWRVGGWVEDEYGARLGPGEIDVVIHCRGTPSGDAIRDREWLERNHAVPGPNSLARNRVDGRHCIGHGDGPWDYIVGEFS